jgi:hypothetical protein
VKVRELLNSPDRWTQGALARDRTGRIVHIGDSEAVCWCLLGAVLYCYCHGPRPRGRGLLASVLQRLRTTIDGGEIAVWGDAPERTFDDVKQVIERLDI